MSRIAVVLTKILLSLAGLYAATEEFLEAFLIDFEGILELHHGVLFLSLIHVIDAVQRFRGIFFRRQGI